MTETFFCGGSALGRRGFLAGFGASAAGLAAGGSVISGGESDKFGQAKKITVRYGFAVENTSRAPVEAAAVAVRAPVALCATQSGGAVRPDPAAALDTDALGNRTLRFRVSRLAPGAVAVLGLQADLEVGRAAAAENAPEEYLKADRWIRSDHPDVVRAALREGAGPTALEKARALSRWVSARVRPSAGAGRASLGAVCALQTGRGDCTECAVLFAALCRAAGVPARVLSGFLLGDGFVLSPSSHHNWAEFHDGVGWRLADPRLGRFCEGGDRYAAVLLWNAGMERTGLAVPDCGALSARMIG